MAGHGSPPPVDRANHPGRQVGRSVVESPRGTAAGRIGSVLVPANTRNPNAGRASVSELVDLRAGRDAGATAYKVEGGRTARDRAVVVRTRKRADIAARSLARRAASGRNIYTGR